MSGAYFLDYNKKIYIDFKQRGNQIIPGIVYLGSDKRAGKNIKKNILSISSLQRDGGKLSLHIGEETFASFTIDAETKTVKLDEESPAQHLTTFETCLLGREKLQKDIPFSRKINRINSQRTDVHAHFASCLPPEKLIEIGLKHNITVAPYFLERLNVNTNNFNVDENGCIPLSDLAKDGGIIQNLKESLALPTDKQASFNSLEEVYRMMNLFSKNPALFSDTLREIGRDMAQGGIKYTELSLAGVISDRECLKTINKLVPEIEKETGCRIRFLAALWRHSDREWNGDEIDRIKAVAQNPYVVGVDFMGHETNSTMAFADDIIDIAKWAMKNDPSFCIRIHAGENPIFQNNVKDAAELIKSARYDLEQEEGRKFTYPNIRVGHGLYGIDDETINLLKDIKAVVEFNMSSNLLLNNIDDLSEIPLKKYMNAKIPFILGTDGRGPYSTSHEQELVLAHAAGISRSDFHRMIITENKIMYNDEVAFTKKSKAFDEKLKTMTFEEALETKFSTSDGKPRFNAELDKKYRNKKQDLIDFLHEEFGRCNVEGNEEKTQKSIHGKLPILLTGASTNSWPKISQEDKKEIRITLKSLVSILDPDKAYFITRGTNQGVEKQFYDVVTEHQKNRDKKLTILGLITDEAFHWNEAKLAENTITNASILTVNNNFRLAKNWLEISDASLWEVKKNQGEIIAIGGASVVRDIIQRGHNMGICMNLMDGPEGASTNRLKVLEGNDYGFKNPKELIMRLYSKHSEIFSKDFDMGNVDNHISKTRADEEKLQARKNAKISDILYSLSNSSTY
ncbi:MAG: hypothetical protein LBR70_01680 [Lactobacillaceae bacterium]|jgi:adenosine deaminase|nr:hypothetical protein [Lactobacillaceae bacterium]